MFLRSWTDGEWELRAGLPGVYRTSTNPGGTMGLPSSENSNYVYYPCSFRLRRRQEFLGRAWHVAKAAVDCEPQSAPAWWSFQMQRPGQPWMRRISLWGSVIVRSAGEGGVFKGRWTAYVLTAAGVRWVDCVGYAGARGSMIFAVGQGSRILPTNAACSVDTGDSRRG